MAAEQVTVSNLTELKRFLHVHGARVQVIRHDGLLGSNERQHRIDKPWFWLPRPIERITRDHVVIGLPDGEWGQEVPNSSLTFGPVHWYRFVPGEWHIDLSRAEDWSRQLHYRLSLV